MLLKEAWQDWRKIGIKVINKIKKMIMKRNRSNFKILEGNEMMIKKDMKEILITINLTNLSTEIKNMKKQIWMIYYKKIFGGNFLTKLQIRRLLIWICHRDKLWNIGPTLRFKIPKLSLFRKSFNHKIEEAKLSGFMRDWSW